MSPPHQPVKRNAPVSGLSRDDPGDKPWLIRHARLPMSMDVPLQFPRWAVHAITVAGWPDGASGGVEENAMFSNAITVAGAVRGSHPLPEENTV